MGSSETNFARQLAERNAEMKTSNVKRFRSSAAPKGTKLRSGYQDRTQLRTSGKEDDKATRVKALEDMVKLGQMDLATFEALRDEIVGGEVKDVHLVKGLDYKLLERVRRGEDVLAGSGTSTQTEGENKEEKRRIQPEANVDDELDKIEVKAIQPMIKEHASKKGEMGPPLAGRGQKRTRDDILRELKASRLAAAESAKQAHESALGPRFMKIGEKKERPMIEKDKQGRVILITVGEDGRMKRKVKKVKSDEHGGLLMPDKDVKPLGMQVMPIASSTVSEDEDGGDIFEDVGVDYNPLGDVEDEGDDSDNSDGDREVPAPSTVPLKPSELETSTSMLPPTMPQRQSPPRRRRNYFDDAEEEENTRNELGRDPLTDPTVLAALRKASALQPFLSSELGSEEEAAKLARRKRMLESRDRDADDMDLEFGNSRFGDAEDGEDGKVKLSVWHGDGGEDEGRGSGQEGKKKRAEKKKKKKKKKGDVNSAAEVLKVIEKRRGVVK